MNVKSLLIVFTGSGLGGCARWGVTLLMGSTLNAFPWATLMTNIIACGMAGFAGTWASSKVDTAYGTLFWLVGFCGGFSTMSAFSREWLQLIQSGATTLQWVYPLATLLLTVLSTAFGAWLYIKI